MLQDKERMLIQCASQGDLEVFTALVGKYANAVYGTAYSVVGDFHHAEDVAQEVFVKVWRKLSLLEDKDKFGSWLFTVTKRMSIDWLRKEAAPSSAPIVETMVASDTLSVEEQVELMERKRSVWKALDSLDETNRSVVIMYYMSGFSAREISEYMGTSLSAVESRLRRAKQKLKRELTGMIEETLVQNKLDQEFEQKVLSKLQGIVVVYIPAYNLEESAAWYENYVGYRVTHRGDIYTLERQGYLKVILVQIGSVSHPVQFNRGGDSNAVLMIGAPDIEEYHTFLKQKGVEVTDITDRGVCGRSFQLKDPAGNRIVIDG